MAKPLTLTVRVPVPVRVTSWLEAAGRGSVTTPRIWGLWSLLTNRTRTAVAAKTPRSAPESGVKTTQPASPVGRVKGTRPTNGASESAPPFTKPLPSTRSAPRRSSVTATCTVPS
jgi:hypothetical protein